MSRVPNLHVVMDADDKEGLNFSIYGPEAVLQEARDENTGACIHTGILYSTRELRKQ